MIKFYLLKTIEAFILPPGIMIVFLLAAYFYLKKHKKIFLFLVIISYLFSIQIVGNILLYPLEKPFSKPPKIQQANLVVVLGGGYIQGSPNLPLSHSAFKRIIYGYKLSKKLKLKMLYNGNKLEIVNAKRVLKEVFGDTKNVIFEDRALNTIDNARLTKLFLKKQNIKNPTIYLVTSAFHMKRAKELFEREKIKVIPAATDFYISKELCFCAFIPSPNGLKAVNLALHEYLGLLVETIKSYVKK